MTVERLEGALRRRFDRDGGVPFVSGDAAALTIDLSGARMKPDAPPPEPVTDGDELAAARLRLAASPLMVHGAEVDVQFDGTDVVFAVAADGSSAAPRRVASGTARLSAKRAALEVLLLAALRERAAAQGATVERVELALRPAGPRAFGVEATLDVKMMLRAAVELSAELAIEDDLAARIVEFEARAGGMLGGMLGAVLDGMAAKVRGKKIALAGAPLAGARVRDVRVHVDDGLTIEADLGA